MNTTDETRALAARILRGLTAQALPFDQREWTTADLHAVEVIAQAIDDKAHEDTKRLNFLEEQDGGANNLDHKPPHERGHVYNKARWVPHASGGRVSECDHYYAPTIREAIDKARGVNQEPSYG